MKTIALAFLLAGFSISVSAQGKKATREAKAFHRAFDLYDSLGYEQGLKAFQDFMESYPYSSFAARAHFNVGYINRQLQRNKEAIEVFRKILDEEYNERDENSLMEPYTLYKHNSCRHLAELYLEEKNYEEAEHFIYLFDKVYPYQHFCGNEWSAYHIYKATMDAKVYEGKNEVEKAVRSLIPLIFSNMLASNDYLLEELVGLLNRHYSFDQVCEELDRALAGIKLVKNKKTESVVMVLFGETVPLDDFFWEHKEIDITNLEKYRSQVKENHLFKAFARTK